MLVDGCIYHATRLIFAMFGAMYFSIDGGCEGGMVVERTVEVREGNGKRERENERRVIPREQRFHGHKCRGKREKQERTKEKKKGKRDWDSQG